jgi:glycosyltransferase involved in cell wall biosynthesis
VFAVQCGGIYSHCKTFIKFCSKHKIDFVFPHLQYPDLVGVLSQYFIRASVWPMRHHADDVYLSANKNALRVDKLINLLSKKILVVSDACKRHMTLHERVSAKKIIVLRLYYKFDFYNKCKEHNGSSVIDAGGALNLITIGRMVANKNHIDLLSVVKKLNDEGIGIRLVLLDTGPLESDLKRFVTDSGLDDKVFFLGRQTDVIKYICEADLLVHTSISESGPQVTKEAGICRKPVVVIKGIGDSDEYIVHGKSGFLLSRDNIRQELYETLKLVHTDRTMLMNMGKELEKAVREKFELNSHTKTYADIINGTIG